LIYLSTLGFGFKIAVRQKDLLFFTFMVLIAIVSFSENLLDVDKGIIFYAFFFSFFVFSNEGFRKTGSHVKRASSAINNKAHVFTEESDLTLPV